MPIGAPSCGSASDSAGITHRFSTSGAFLAENRETWRDFARHMFVSRAPFTHWCDG
jgi:hypothetical protein